MARYGKAFKDRAVARLLPPENATLDDVAREYGVGVATLERWRSATPARTARFSRRVTVCTCGPAGPRTASGALVAPHPQLDAHRGGHAQPREGRGGQHRVDVDKSNRVGCMTEATTTLTRAGTAATSLDTPSKGQIAWRACCACSLRIEPAFPRSSTVDSHAM